MHFPRITFREKFHLFIISLSPFPNIATNFNILISDFPIRRKCAVIILKIVPCRSAAVIEF